MGYLCEILDVCLLGHVPQTLDLFTRLPSVHASYLQSAKLGKAAWTDHGHMPMLLNTGRLPKRRFRSHAWTLGGGGPLVGRERGALALIVPHHIELHAVLKCQGWRWRVKSRPRQLRLSGCGPYECCHALLLLEVRALPGPLGKRVKPSYFQKLLGLGRACDGFWKKLSRSAH